MEENQNQMNNQQDQPYYTAPQSGNEQQPNYGQQGYGQQPNYGQPNYGQQYNNPPVFYNGNGGFGQVQHGPVTDIFNYLLMGCLIVQYILGIIVVEKMFSVMNYHNLEDGTFIYAMMDGSYYVISVLSSLIGLAVIIFFVLDIVNIHKQNYKIIGLILFAILLKPGYFIWRAYVLGKKKLVPIIYTVTYGVVTIAYIFYIVWKVLELVEAMTMYLY